MIPRNAIEAYLDRIAFSGVVKPDLLTLRQIQKQHLLHVPFENLDIHMGNTPDLSAEALFMKVVTRERGGICYELNGLLLLMLRAIGYDVRALGGHVLGEMGSPFDHLFLIVSLPEGEYLVDVGFGDNYLEPLRFLPDLIQKDGKGDFRIKRTEDIRFSLEKRRCGEDDFSVEYTFEDREREISEFLNRMEYFYSNGASPFKKNLFCSLEREKGRISLKQDKLIITDNSNRREVEVSSKSAFFRHLDETFSLRLSENQKKRLDHYLS